MLKSTHASYNGSYGFIVFETLISRIDLNITYPNFSMRFYIFLKCYYDHRLLEKCSFNFWNKNKVVCKFILVSLIGRKE